MKTRPKILIYIILLFCLAIVPGESIKADTEMPILTNELPSTSFLKSEKRSIANSKDLERAGIAMPEMARMPRSNSWSDPFLPGTKEEISNAANVGAAGPIGDITFPIVLSILLFYLIYRGVSTSRRRNNF